MNIQWYPGHMAKARRMLEDSLKLVDVVVEMADARAPLATRNPDLDALFAQKPRVLVLNKADLADERITKAWLKHFADAGWEPLSFSANAGKGVKPAIAAVNQAAQPVVERWKKKGVRKTVRAMIVGIPNVGKSTFINRLKGGSSAKAGDKPGVTRGKQWIVLSPYLEFLDTPGMLWPKLDDQQAALRLALLGSIREEIMDSNALASALLETLRALYPQGLEQRLKLSAEDIANDALTGAMLLEKTCIARGWLRKGGVPDEDRAAMILLDEFRAGKMGRVTLELPPAMQTQKAEEEDTDGSNDRD